MEVILNWRWELFGLGILGAFLTVYLSKQEVIPEFRPLFDTFKKRLKRDELQEHVDKTRKENDELQDMRFKEKNESVRKDISVRISENKDEIAANRKQIEYLDKTIKHGQILTRGIGFLFYIVLGGVFGSLLSNIVEVKAFEADIPKIFEAFVIGSGWPTLLSVIGFIPSRKKADEKMEETAKKIDEKIENSMKDVEKRLGEELANVKARKLKIENIDIEKITDAKIKEVKKDVNKLIGISRQEIQMDMKGIL